MTARACAGCALAILVLVPASASAASRVFVPVEDGAAPAYKPSSVDFSADGGDDWSIMRWLSYGGRRARAVAETESNDCKPDCARGRRTPARTTIVFRGRVPCYGRQAYARLSVVRTTNRSVAPVGSGRDLTQFCGYVAFRPGLACLVREGRAVGVGAQRRCFDSAVRAGERKLARERAAIVRLLAPGSRRAFAGAERIWQRYRRSSCAAMASLYEGGSIEPVVRAACLFDRTTAHVADLAARAPFQH